MKHIERRDLSALVKGSTLECCSIPDRRKDSMSAPTTEFRRGKAWGYQKLMTWNREGRLNVIRGSMCWILCSLRRQGYL